MADQTLLQKIFVTKGFSDYCWIDPQEIVVAQWVRMKSLFGCDSYGSASSPPNTPSLADCREFFREFHLGVLFHFARHFSEPEERRAWSRDVNRALVDLERSVFIAGYPKVFLLFMDSCNLCRECAASRAACRNKKLARPSPEGMGVDVFATVAKYNFPIQVLGRYDQEINQYAFLLIE